MYQNNPYKCRTGEVRLSYVNLVTPKANPNAGADAQPKYSATLLIPKTDTRTVNDINTAIKAAYEQGVQSKWKGARPQMKHATLADGDGLRENGEPFGDECKGHYVVTARTTRKPGVVDMSLAPLDPSDIYSGMYAQVTINFYPYDASGSRGVGCALGNVLKTRDGEPLGGGASAEADFADLADAANAPFVDPITGMPI